MNYYNENDPKACAWLRELISANLIPDGHIDQRSIEDVKPSDLNGFTQHHFFAGIGGWPLALKLAGWPEDKPVCTGSCPCQPLSCAGQRKGHADKRHLWPAFFRLISECGFPTVFGEQVAGKDGREWLSGIRTDLEGAGYAVGSANLCAAGTGAPHIRQRLYWVANAQNRARMRPIRCSDERINARGSSEAVWVGNSKYGRCEIGKSAWKRTSSIVSSGFWSNYELVHCLDGKTRRFESGSFPLAHGVPGRVGLLRGYGNAIVPQVAATFIMSAIEAMKSEAAGEWSGKCVACGHEYQHLPENDEGVCANCGCHSVEQITNRIPLRPNNTAPR